MGTRHNESGITVQLYDHKGKPTGRPFVGRFSRIAGKARKEIVAKDPLRDDEVSVPGSEDWLTVVAVADTASRLDALLNSADVKTRGRLQLSQSSHSSRRVLVAVHVGKDKPKIFKNRITVASGPILSLDKDNIEIKVAHLKVLPEGAKLGARHPLRKEFVGGSPANN